MDSGYGSFKPSRVYRVWRIEVCHGCLNKKHETHPWFRQAMDPTALATAHRNPDMSKFTDRLQIAGERPNAIASVAVRKLADIADTPCGSRHQRNPKLRDRCETLHSANCSLMY